MSRKVSLKNKKKWSALLKNAHKNEMSLSFFNSLLEQVKEIKKIERDKKKFGEYLHWADAKSDNDLWLSVPIFSKKDNAPTGMTRMLTNREEAEKIIPLEYSHLLNFLKTCCNPPKPSKAILDAAKRLDEEGF